MPQRKVLQAITHILNISLWAAIFRLDLLLNHLVNQADLLKTFLLHFLHFLLKPLTLHRWVVQDARRHDCHIILTVQKHQLAGMLRARIFTEPIASEHRGQLLLGRLLLNGRVLLGKFVHNYLVYVSEVG